MRFIPTFCLKEGMVLGKDLYNNTGNLLLKKGSNIKREYMEKIIEIGVQGIYIEDNISKDIEIKNTISDELRIKSVQGIKNVFINVEKNKNNIEHNMKQVNTIVESMVDEILENKNLMVNMMDIKLFDDYTFFHSVNVATLSIIMGISLNLNKEELYKLGLGALLHDIGKVFINQDILNKKGKLEGKEIKEMKLHPLKGYKYIKSNFDLPAKSYIAILDHHEKYDGTGYPNKKCGKDICLFGRIIAIADVYDALTSNRSYRKALLPSDAVEYIMAGCGSHFDFELVNLFTRKVAAYPIGTCVKLSNGSTGIVVENYPDPCTRPKIKLIDSSYEETTYIDLKNDSNSKNITIVDIANI